MRDERENSYKVTDRRKFHADGTPREQLADAPGAVAQDEPAAANEPAAASNVVAFPDGGREKEAQVKPPAEPVASGSERDDQRVSGREDAAEAATTARGSAEEAYSQARGPQPTGQPEASFLELLNMLGIEAALHLGLIRRQGEEPPPVDLEAARHVIDLIGMLQRKTHGNLTGEEGQLLENVLADLRLQYVTLAKKR